MDRKAQKRHPLLKHEDYWAIWIGGFLLIIGLGLFFIPAKNELSTKIEEINPALDAARMKAPFESVEWHELYAEKKTYVGTNTYIGKKIKKLTAKPKVWNTNPMDAFISSENVVTLRAEDRNLQKDEKSSEVDILYQQAWEAEELAGSSDFENKDLNSKAIFAIENWVSKKSEYSDFLKKSVVKPFNLLPAMLLFGLLLSLLFGIGAFVMGISFRGFILGFAGVFMLSVLAFLFASQVDMKQMGLGYAIWAIGFGMVISNTIGIPAWIKPALQTEFYIKTGLVLLGAEILFGKILTIGLPGIFVAWVVTPIVLVSTFWFGQKVLKMSSKTLNITISADMSVCGVSAAIATAAACGAKKEELTLAVGLSMIFTSVMMIVLPLFINAMNMPEVLGGAWIGGTIDATGAVVAAGAFLGDRAMNVAATIKMIQNILIGVIAFGVAVYWSVKVEKTGQRQVGIGEIWNRFPKFILGFLGASIIFSIIYASIDSNWAYALIDHGVLRGFTKDIRAWLFCLAFVSIGLSTNFKELKEYFKGGKPLLLYVSGQLLNLILTLLMAYLMFYVIFPEITEKI